jgi:hypothetical protein
MVGEMLTHQQLGALRRSPAEELVRSACSIQALRFVFQGIQARTGSPLKAYQLAAYPSLTGGFYSAVFALANYWIAYCGIDTAKPAKLTNDLHDLDYIVLASLCSGLGSEDGRAKTIHHFVVSASRARTAWFRDAESFGPEAACNLAASSS